MENWRQKLKEKAKKITKECNYEGWNGYDALPIKSSSLENTIRLIKLLPEKIQIPDIDPEPTGNIGLEWHPKKNLILSMALYKNKISYAAILDNKNVHGEEPFKNALPKTIEDILTTYFPK